jgi:hypothetical protein
VTASGDHAARHQSASHLRQRTGEALHQADACLLAMIRGYQEMPPTIDEAVLVDGRTGSVELAIVENYRLLQTLVFAESSPISAEQETWEAFREQQDELAGFYGAALAALECYREVLAAYRIVQQSSAPPRRGDMQRIRRDKHLHVAERDACLAAVTEFQRKFSAMLPALHPVPLP